MIPLPSKPKIIEKKDNSAIFEIDSLYPGYGVTIGNSLRRILLSSLPGAAVTQVKIRGVQHEFSTIPGVLEDVVNILLNIKQLRFKLHTQEPQRVKLSLKGAKTVVASDFTLPTQVELQNKDAHVATLTSKSSSLDMEILIEPGMGYEPVEKRKLGKPEIGTISLDAIFTPIRKVSYKVESMRVGERTDFDKLILDLETDGSLTPEQAFSQAADILIQHFNLFKESLDKTLPVKPVKPAIKKKAPVKDKKTLVKKNEKKKKGKKTK
ncbi:MAG: DNA-directed RNA polymerase subunit alpha [Candidatus Nealsonbacteria bacterium]